MGGGIAYLADIVGKKLGKKRLSVFGLRPRQTAALGTVLVGVLITSFTIALALLFSKPMRQALLHTERVRMQLAKDQEDLQNLESEVKKRSDRNTTLAKTNGGLTATIADRQAKLLDAQTKLAGLNANIKVLQSKIGIVNLKLSRGLVAFNTSQKALQATNIKLSKVQTDLKANQNKLTYVVADNQDLEKKSIDYVRQNEKLLALQKQLGTEKAKLEADLTKIKHDVEGLEEAKQANLAEIERTKSELTDFQNQLSNAKAELATTQAQLDQATMRLEQFRSISEVARTQQMIFRANQEVARYEVKDGLSVKNATDALQKLMTNAGRAAQSRGAINSRRTPSVLIVSYRDPQTGEFVTPEMIERRIVRQITGATGYKVLVAVSTLNAFRGEAVSLEISVHPDPLVYTKGQLIAETVIHGNESEDALLQELGGFLQDKVRAQALKDGMIPVSNSDVSLGQVTPTDLLQIIDQLRRTDHMFIRFEARAARNTRAADELKLEFRQKS